MTDKKGLALLIQKIQKTLFSGNLIKSVIAWLLLLSLFVNFIIEPISTFSKRIQLGPHKNIPGYYLGIWESDINDGEVDHYLEILKQKAIYSLYVEGKKEESIECAHPLIAYDFENYKQRYGHKTYFGILDLLLRLFLPQTLFGSQFIELNCDEKRTLYFSEPLDINGYQEISVKIIRQDDRNLEWYFWRK